MEEFQYGISIEFCFTEWLQVCPSKFSFVSEAVVGWVNDCDEKSRYEDL